METTSPVSGKDITEMSVEQRISNELRDLKGRINKLKRFLGSPGMADINHAQEFLMNEQLDAMIDYEKCLSLRHKEILRNSPTT